MDLSGFSPAQCVLLTTRVLVRRRCWTLAGAVLGTPPLPQGRIFVVPSGEAGFVFCDRCELPVAPRQIGDHCSVPAHSDPLCTVAEIDALLKDAAWSPTSKAVRRELRDFVDCKGGCGDRRGDLRFQGCAALFACCARKANSPGCSAVTHRKAWRGAEPLLAEVVTAVPGEPLQLPQDRRKGLLMLNQPPQTIREDNWFGPLDMLHSRQVGFNVAGQLSERGKPRGHK